MYGHKAIKFQHCIKIIVCHIIYTILLIRFELNRKDKDHVASKLPSSETIRNLLEESIKYAKESLQLDAKDGMSWYILANCYVAKFFSPFGQQNSSILKQAISAYNLALKDELVASLQSDLYFNKSMISMYEENWPDTLYCLCRALNLDPHWTDVKENLKGTLNYLLQINELVAKKGKLKAKKFQTLVESLKPSDLGPYADSAYQVPNKPEKIDLIQCTVRIDYLTDAKRKRLETFLKSKKKPKK